MSEQPETEFSAKEKVDAVVSDLLVRQMITPQAVERAARAAQESGERVDEVLRKLGLASDDHVTDAWSRVLGIEIVAAGEYPNNPLFESELPSAFLRYAKMIPIAINEDIVTVAISDPLSRSSSDAIAVKLQRQVIPKLGRPGELQTALTRLYGGEEVLPSTGGSRSALTDDVDRLRDIASNAPVIKLASAIIDRAIELRASDIHLVAEEHRTRVRYRIDGALRDFDPVPSQMHAALVSRIKIMASLDIGERRLPQDGRVRIAWRGRDIDLRVATAPQLKGEGVVLRILDHSTNTLKFEQLGMSTSLVAGLRRAIEASNGIVLVTGPTGSGKTTTLYAALREVARPDRNVVTVEDPIEYRLNGTSQIQVNTRIGLDFATLLRAVLRHDPDIIMIGEIRDRETAAIATQAALTGHLVLATIHTNTAAAAVPRLIDMGVDPYLIAATLRACLAQRLVRRLCTRCSTEF